VIPQPRASIEGLSFAGSDANGKRAVVIYSLAGSANLNALIFEHFLRQVFAQIAEHPICRIEELLL
jgi:hypothetical protein